MIFAGITLKFENVDPTFSSFFNPCPPLLSVATDNRKKVSMPKNSVK